MIYKHGFNLLPLFVPLTTDKVRLSNPSPDSARRTAVGLHRAEANPSHVRLGDGSARRVELDVEHNAHHGASQYDLLLGKVTPGAHPLAASVRNPDASQAFGRESRSLW